MKNKLTTILFSALATVGFIGLTSSHLSSTPQQGASPYEASSFQKRLEPQWEYKVEFFARAIEDLPNSDVVDQLERRMKTLGDRGWEYAGILRGKGVSSRFVAFKRLK